MNKLHATIKHLVVTGEFIKTRSLYPHLSKRILSDTLGDIALSYDDNPLTAYAFSCFLLQEKERVAHHTLAITMAELLCHVPGAYAISLYHTKKALELEPDNLALKENLIFLRQVPERVVALQEAVPIAQELKRKKPESHFTQAFNKNFYPKNNVMSPLKESLKKLIMHGEYLQTKSLYAKFSTEELEVLLKEIILFPPQKTTRKALVPSNLIFPAYSFAWFLINEARNEKHHMLAAYVLQLFNPASGAFILARFHIERAIKIRTSIFIDDLLNVQAQQAKYIRQKQRSQTKNKL